MSGDIYNVVVHLRQLAWDRRGEWGISEDDMSAAPDNEARWWYHQGRAEAFAQVMTLLEMER